MTNDTENLKGSTMKRTNLMAVLAGFAAVAAISQEAFARNRMYNPSAGRFMQRDPYGTDQAGTDLAGPAIARSLSDPQYTQRDPAKQYRDGMNLYQYVRSNPPANIDPFGLRKTQWITFKIDPGEGSIIKIILGQKDLGHGWIVFGPEAESYGWYPDRQIKNGADGLVGTTGDLNGLKFFNGKLKMDPHETVGEGKAKFSFHPDIQEDRYLFGIIRVETPKLQYGQKKGTACNCVQESDIMDCIRSLAANKVAKKDPWRLVGGNCMDFLDEAAGACCLNMGGVHTDQ
jgi:hypothetical protein